MLKLRNAVLTALLAFCLAMPFVSCSFNDGATGDVSNLVKEQTGNNQNGGNENPSGGDNGGNGGSTGGNEKPSGGDEDSGDNGNENPSGGNNGGSGNENPSGGNEKPTDPTEPGAGTTYVVIYNGDIIEESLSESMWFYGVEKVNLEEVVDYTMKGNEITLTYSGYQKVLPLLGSSGGDGGQEPGTDEPVPDVPVPDVPVDVEGTMYTVKYGDTVIVPAMPESELSHFETVLTKNTDYTISGNVITLTESGYEKVMAAMSGTGAGE